jgi:hypothetical protein
MRLGECSDVNINIVNFFFFFPPFRSAADVVEKIEWLKSHDKEAQQIAVNARNFGLSYLRLEDQYCYVATLLDTLGGLSDVVYVVSV